jgi:hypothetical protein
VVVLAIDVRYITRALEATYKDVLVRSGEPSGLDYIEKIIQIPYRVRTVSVAGIKRFLSVQMDFEPQASGEQGPEPGAVTTTPVDQTDDAKAGDQAQNAKLAESVSAVRAQPVSLPTSVLKFEADDYAVISESCSTIVVSPRAMKRLVNVFKLMKIIWHGQGLEEGPDRNVKKVMLSILALCSRYPEVLRKLLADMENYFRDEASDLSQPLAKYLSGRATQGAIAALYPPDWTQVASVLNIDTFFPSKLSFSRLGEANLHLLSSFSFVGETDAEREATLTRGFYSAPPDRARAPEPPDPGSFGLP